MKKIFTIAFLICSATLQAQINTVAATPLSHHSTENKYWIYFTDKKDSPFSIGNPEQFLSKRSISRRMKYHISINNSDLPVNQNYVLQLQTAGVQVDVASRWLNAVSAYLTIDQIATISQLPFVKEIAKVNTYVIDDENAVPFHQNAFYKSAEETDAEGLYGFADVQINQINLDTVLEMGYTGGDMVIAVLDAGFFGVDTATLYQSFWDKGQILGYHNFPDHNDQVFNIGSGIHGAWVMSVIGGDIPDTFSGSAPDIQFYLYRTEVADSEHVVEEDYWLAAAERADSVGADLINSSLGYTTFDDPLENHTYADLDGNTTVVTNAADMAAQKGILVCNSAGNEGQNSWHYVSMPSDGDSVLSTGAVDAFGIHAGFSGFGPTSDGRIKPNVMAMGLGSAMLDPYGNIAFLSGTSFSSPLMAGACASLWQAFPTRSNMDIIDAVQRSAHLYLTPNDSMGYGIPNFGMAYEILKAETVIDTTITDSCYAYFEFETSDSMTYYFTNLSLGSDSSEIISYSWNFCDGGISTDYNPVHIFAVPGPPCACLTIADTMGCESTYCYSETTDVNPDHNYSVVAYSNADGNSFNIDIISPYNEHALLQLYNLSGEMISVSNATLTSDEHYIIQFNTDQGMAAGIYFISVTTDHYTTSKKIMVR